MNQTNYDQIMQDFEDYLFANSRCALSSIRQYQAHVRQFLLEHAAQFTLKDIKYWLASKQKDRNIITHKYALKHFLCFLGKKPWVDHLPQLRTMPRKKNFKFVPKETLQSIINEVRREYKYIVLLQAKTGARISEILTLRAENIDFNAHPQLIYMRVGLDKTIAKGKKERALRISKDKYGYIIRKIVKKPNGYIFLPSKYEYADEDKLLKRIKTITRAINRELNRVGDIHGVDNLSTHYLRHIFSDYFLLGSNYNLPALQRVLGHTKIDTTGKYIQVEDRMADSILLKVDSHEI